jgi:uncharacterized protein (DUF2235 family)
MSQNKNIVICCDGTANEFAENDTNVWKIYSTLVNEPGRQVTYYHPGLGTMEPAGTLTPITRKVTKLLGMALGYGLADDIRDAYVFLMKNYEPEDRVFLFGFSRGAYTVRAVASLLKMYGLIRKNNESLVPYATRLLMGAEQAHSAKERQEVGKYFGLAADFKYNLSCDCKPWFVGVWDTVSSVGWIENPLKLPYIANNPDIKIGRHAVAIDERRAFFRNHLWRKPNDGAVAYGPTDVMQVWFPGVHCDVGGGYAENESGLSKIALEWMIEEAVAAGLAVETVKVTEMLGKGSDRHVRPDFNAPAHESLTGWWHVAELVPRKRYDWQTGQTHRRMNLWSRRRMPSGSLVHEAAFQRDNYKNRIPRDAVMVKTPHL